ncbi:MAG: hypothetical protein AB8G22_22090 [Saprospiraceae bacterium]
MKSLTTTTINTANPTAFKSLFNAFVDTITFKSFRTMWNAEIEISFTKEDEVAMYRELGL